MAAVGIVRPRCWEEGVRWGNSLTEKLRPCLEVGAPAQLWLNVTLGLRVHKVLR